MQPNLNIQGLNIVLVGNFNPTIFQPRWFSVNKLIGDHESEQAQIQIIHPDLAQFSTDWLSLSVDRQRFQVGTILESHYEPLRDFVIGTFRLLCYTPLTQMGINRNFHFGLRSPQELGVLLNHLSPTKGWGTALQNPRMQTLVIQGDRQNGLCGYIRVTVEPSIKIRHGVYVEINDHYEFGDPANGELGASIMMDILNNRWSESLQTSERIAEHTIKRTDEK